MSQAPVVKLVVIGDEGVGKSTLIRSFVSGQVLPRLDPSESARETVGGSDYYEAGGREEGTLGERGWEGARFLTLTKEVGADYACRAVHILGKEAMLQIWDTDGPPETCFSFLGDSFFRGLNACILVFDASDPDSLSQLARWYEEASRRVTQFLRRVSGGNALAQRRMTPEFAVFASKCDGDWAPEENESAERTGGERKGEVSESESEDEGDEDVSEGGEGEETREAIESENDILEREMEARTRRIKQQVRMQTRAREREERREAREVRRTTRARKEEMKKRSEVAERWCRDRNIILFERVSAVSGLGLVDPGQTAFDYVARAVLIGRDKGHRDRDSPRTRHGGYPSVGGSDKNRRSLHKGGTKSRAHGYSQTPKVGKSHSERARHAESRRSKGPAQNRRAPSPPRPQSALGPRGSKHEHKAPPRPLIQARTEPGRGDNWEDDSKVSKCGPCGKSFGLFVRKHHCRMCGMVFCDPCTRNRVRLPGQSEDVRVCVACSEEATR